MFEYPVRIEHRRGMAPKDVTEEMHAEFYKFISGDKQPPAFKLHFQCAKQLCVGRMSHGKGRQGGVVLWTPDACVLLCSACCAGRTPRCR